MSGSEERNWTPLGNQTFEGSTGSCWCTWSIKDAWYEKLGIVIRMGFLQKIALVGTARILRKIDSLQNIYQFLHDFHVFSWTSWLTIPEFGLCMSKTLSGK